MSKRLNLPLEQHTKDESTTLDLGWNSGPYSFLLQRTQEKYGLLTTQKRRHKIESELHVTLPMITDEMLLGLYKHACHKYRSKCRSHYGFTSGFLKTSAENTFAKTLQYIIDSQPNLKHLEIYPSSNHSRDLPPNYKMVVGNYVPDFLIFGLKIRGCSAVAIEVDGDSHIQKWRKDDLRNRHLKELKIFTFEVQNHQVGDLQYLTKAIMDMYRLRNGSLNSQIQRAKRSIWVKTIACQMSLEEVEGLLLQYYGVRMNLLDEATAAINDRQYPRAVKSELRKLSIPQL